MAERQIPLSFRFGAAALAILPPLVVLWITWEQIRQIGAEEIGHVGLQTVLDENAVPDLSFITIVGRPKNALSMQDGDSAIYAFVTFGGQPGLVIFGTTNLDFTHEVQGSEPGSEYFQVDKEVSGQIVSPRDARLPHAQLRQFVDKNLDGQSFERVRVLIVDAKPEDARTEGVFGALCILVLIAFAVALWAHVIWTWLRSRAMPAPEPEE